ncbi:protein kinase kinase kinase [Perkinsus olseni]|uniref:Protein kinase kinase kinase n=1 Tax=Perkinsus olseni TaxID=32597 RepID=A0A7J6S1B5_PEROL|nr:protein kinase kinase kinase [Perkinsus olseni]
MLDEDDAQGPENRLVRSWGPEGVRMERESREMEKMGFFTRGTVTRRRESSEGEEGAERPLCAGSRWEIDPAELQQEERIGRGSTAEVYRGTWKGKTVAIKEFRTDNRKNLILKRELEATLKFCAEACHPNIVRFYGAALSTAPLLLVTEYCAGGSVFHFVYKRTTLWDTSLQQKLKMCLDVARAMRYLHSVDPPMLHRDLKSLNLLLAHPLDGPSDEPVVKVTDFGLARAKAERDESMTRKVGTIWWMAPEVLDSTHYDERADIYSYAIVCYEILSEMPPFRELNPIKVTMKILSGERPDLYDIPPDVPASLIAMLTQCWSAECGDRLSFAEIVKSLEELREKLLKKHTGRRRPRAGRGSCQVM